MDETIITEHQLPEEMPDLILTTEAQSYLQETAKWARFLGIAGFILCGAMLVGAIFGDVFTTYRHRLNPEPYYGVARSRTFTTVMYVIIALIHIFPSIYAYRFGTQMQRSLFFNDESYLTESFGNLKSLYKFWGTVAIVYMCLAGLVILGVIIISAFLSLRH